MFKWSCFALAVVSVLGLAWVINDVRLEVKRTTESVNKNLPEILDKTKKSTETLAVLSDDIKQLRDMLGGPRGEAKNSLVAYADDVLDLVEASGGLIGVEKLIGHALKEPAPAAEWVVTARREAAVQTLRVRSKQELLTRLTKNKFGFEWQIQMGDAAPQTLETWVRANHPESGELPEEDGELPESN